MKEQILKEHRGLAGIYRWVNKVNGNTYVGSGENLSKRFISYYSVSELKRNTRPIHSALLKYGYDNFQLEILEYCNPSSPTSDTQVSKTKFGSIKNILIEREQYYLDLLIPEYNILKFAYSNVGYKHTPENIALFKLKEITTEHKEILSLTHKGKIVSKVTKEKLSLATTKYKKDNPLSAEALSNLKAKTIEREGVAVVVINTQTKQE